MENRLVYSLLNLSYRIAHFGMKIESGMDEVDKPTLI